MLNIWISNFNEPIVIVDLVICIILTILAITLLIFYFHKIPTIYLMSGVLLSAVVCYIFGLQATGVLLFVIFIVLAGLFSFANISELRHFFIKTQQKKKKASKVYDKAAFYRVIDDTVHSLSKSKTGAIMTFERSTNLDDIIKNGTIINAPVSQELLETIFYEGTRLHDGAVVIRDNIIIAASVYYTPTTRALTGKYGSRHRAAFGISEISDSITVVVSEETGRVAIAYNGNLESVPLDSFLREFSDMMTMEE